MSYPRSSSLNKPRKKLKEKKQGRKKQRCLCDRIMRSVVNQAALDTGFGHAVPNKTSTQWQDGIAARQPTLPHNFTTSYVPSECTYRARMIWKPGSLSVATNSPVPAVNVINSANVEIDISWQRQNICQRGCEINGLPCFV
jgi:hypothetical protein